MNDQADSSSYLQRALTTAGLVVLALAVLHPLLYLAHVLLLVFAGVLVAVFLGGLARYMSYFTPLSRPLSLAVVVLALLGIGIGFSFVFGPHLASQIAQLADRLPNAVRHFQHTIQRSEWARRLFTDAPALTTLAPSLEDVLGGITNVFSQTLSLLTQVVIVALIGIYGAANPRGYVRSVMLLVPPTNHQRAREVMHAVGRALRWWLVGRFVSMMIVGILTVIGLWLIGIPSALALGFIAAVTAFVPYIGPILALIPAILVALLMSGTKIFAVLILYVAVQAVESYLITPLVQERAVSLLPAALITAQVTMGVLLGPLGLALATPLAVSIIVVIQMLYIEDVLGVSVKILGEHSN